MASSARGVSRIHDQHLSPSPFLLVGNYVWIEDRHGLGRDRYCLLMRGLVLSAGAENGMFVDPVARAVWQQLKSLLPIFFCKQVSSPRVGRLCRQ